MTKHLALAKRIGVTAAALFVLGAIGYRQRLLAQGGAKYAPVLRSIRPA
jgi:hypothetical protein